jgi:hypothetical protein
MISKPKDLIDEAPAPAADALQPRYQFSRIASLWNHFSWPIMIFQAYGWLRVRKHSPEKKSFFNG